MKKIISLFQRNHDGDRKVRDEITHGAEWVAGGEGEATRKWDGTACLWKDGKLWKRYDAKNGKTPPVDFVPAQEPDKLTGHWPGWVPVDVASDKWFAEALRLGKASTGMPDGSDSRMVKFKEGQTYELIGPKINQNSDKAANHVLVEHGALKLDAPRTFKELQAWFKDEEIEGIVWHHPDGRMVKIKKKDFPKLD